MGYHSSCSCFSGGFTRGAFSRKAGVQLLESQENKEKTYRKRGKRSSGLWIQALAFLFPLFLTFCSPELFPAGHSGWFEAVNSKGQAKGRFFFRKGEFLRIEIMGCSFNLKGKKVYIFDTRRKEYWGGNFKEISEKFPSLPSVKDMEKIWRGESIDGYKILSLDGRGRLKTMEFQDGTLIRILKIGKGASLNFPEGYKKVRMERICSRLSPTQR